MKPKKPGDLIRKVNAKKHHKSPSNPYEETMANRSRQQFAIQPKFSSTQLAQSRASLSRARLNPPSSLRSMASSSPSSIMKKKKPGKHKKNWIAGAIKHPGALHRQLGIKAGRKIPSKTLARAAAKGGKVGRRARLAETLKGLHHKKNDQDADDTMKKSKHSVHHKAGTHCKGC